MLNLETRQIQILSILLQKQYISLEQLISLGRFSQNTILLELRDINDIFKESGLSCQIVNHRGKGYTLSYDQEDQEIIENIKEHCDLYLSIPNHSTSSHYERIIYLLRYLLYKRENIKSEELSQKMNISLATLNKDLRVVRQILKKYHISIESVPYYGMHLVGKELAIRSCFIDYCDLYIVNEENIFPQYFMEQFDFTYEQFYDVYCDIRDILIEKTIGIDEYGIKRLSLYVLMLPILSRYAKENEIKSLNISHPFQTLPYLSQLSTFENNLLSLFYMSVLEISHIDFTEGFEQCIDHLSDTFHECTRKISELSGLYIDFHSPLYYFIQQVIYKASLRKKYGLYNLSVPFHIKNKLRKEIGSYSFSHYIIHAFDPEDTELSQDYLFYEIVVNIYGIVYNIKNEYYPCRALVVNGYGKSFAKIATQRLKRSISTMIDYIPCHEYELDTIDFSRYDFVLAYDCKKMNLQDIPIPVYQEQMRNMDKSSILIWSNHIVNKRKVKVLRPYLDSPIYSTLLQNVDIVDTIIDVFTHTGYQLSESYETFYKLIEKMIYDGLYNSTSEIKIITLYTKQEMTYKYFAFNLQQPIQIENGKIVLLHFLFLDSSNGPIVIKNSDSELRRYFNI